MSMSNRFGRGLTLTVLALAAAAWVLLAWPGNGWHAHSHPSESSYSITQLDDRPPAVPEQQPSGHHHGGPVVPSTTVSPAVPAAPLFGPVTVTVLVGWVLMVTAMMLPPALPILDLLRRLVSRHRHPRLLIGLGALGFVGVWTAAGVLLIASDAAARGFAEQVGRPAGPVAAGAVLILAGLYQFTPMKTACLRACRTPRGFAVAHWRGARPAWLEAPTVTGAYAASCVGCCWALMAVTFVVGVAALPVMVVLAVLMAAERLLRHGRRLVRPIGAVTVALGVLALFELVPAGLLAA